MFRLNFGLAEVAHLTLRIQTIQNIERVLLYPDHSCLHSTGADAKLALEELYGLISKQMTFNPEAPVTVTGDFNHVELKAVLPNFWKFIYVPTRENNILDQLYCNIPGSYRATAAPHKGMSDLC